MKMNLEKFGFVAILFAALTFSISSCAKKAEQKEEVESDSIVVVEEIPETKNYSAYSFEQKDEVIADVKAELGVIDKKIEDLKAEAAKKQQELSADTKTTYENAVKDLEKTRDDLKTKVENLEKSTAETWENAKTEAANAYNTAVDGVENAYKSVKSAVLGVVNHAKDDSI